MGTATSSMLGPLLMGWLVDVQGYGAAFSWAVGFYVLATLVYFIGRRDSRQPSPGAIKRALKEAQEAAARG